MVSILAVSFLGAQPFWRELSADRHVLFWPLLGGFMWVVGDLLQNYAAKYVGISRGIPLSNTNQLWGLLWAILVFGELHDLDRHVYAEVIGGSLLMAIGALAIASSYTSDLEYSSWKRAAQRETDLYRIDPEYVNSRMEGRDPITRSRRTGVDWLIVLSSTCIFGAFAAIARLPHMQIQMVWLIALTSAMVLVLLGSGLALWRVTKFN